LQRGVGGDARICSGFAGTADRWRQNAAERTIRAFFSRPFPAACPPSSSRFATNVMPQWSASAYRSEVRANLQLALPLMAAQLAGVGMGTVDTVFAGRLGPDALAAVAVGVNLNVVFWVFSLGLAMACSPIVAHAVGAGHSPVRIGAFMRSAQRFALLLGLSWMLLLNACAAPVLQSLHLSAETTRQAIAFERWLSLSAFGMSLWLIRRFCCEGLGRTRPIFIAGVAGLLLNALLDWLLLFGHWGLPAMGAPGCGLATAVSSLAMAAVLGLYFRRLPALRAAPAPGEPASGGVRDLLRLGLPIGATLTAEAGLFVVASLLMARFGDAAVAAHQVALNFASLAFMIPLGIGLATTVRVGLAAGAGDGGAARFRGQVGMSLGLLNALSNATILSLLPLSIAGLYTSDPGIAARAARFLVLAAVFQLFDGLQVTANGALRGIKDARVPLLLTLLAYWVVGIPVACLLAFRSSAGPAGLWWGMTAGLCVAAAGLSGRFLARTKVPVDSA
jgi:MATE family multidrug resistance protein